MSANLFEEIRKSKEAFLDISQLSSPDLGPILQRALFHLDEIKQNINSKNNESVEYLNPILQKGLSAILEEELLSLKHVNSQSVSISNQVSLSDWKKLVAILPIVKDFVQKFPLKEYVNIELVEGILSIKSIVNNNFDLNEIRSFSYSASKSLIRKNTILTYKLNSKNNEEIEFSFDFSNSAIEVYGIEISDELKISFDSRLANYIVDHTKDNFSLDCHIFIELEEKGRVNRYPGFPHDFNAKQNTNELIFFPFLFRHVVLSLPKKGKIICNNIINAENKKNIYHYIDLFSLISE